MVWVIVILVIISVLIGLSFASRSDIVTWLDDMRRVKIGGGRTEWLAPEVVMHTVIQHYQEYIEFAQENLLKGWVGYAKALPTYMTHNMLTVQLGILDARLLEDNLRLIDILRTSHRVHVRNFGDDGLTCLLLDYQTERRLATYHYWTRRRIHTQHLNDAILVYEMQFDSDDQRWKLANFIQELPPHYYQQTIEGALDTLENNLPPFLGRDG